MPSEYDVVVIGTGPAASRVAVACAGADRRVAVIDSRGIGGTCALRGCNPKKVLVRAAELLDWIRRSQGELISGADEGSIDWSQLIEFKRTFTEPVTPKAKEKFAKKDIAVYEGTASFVGPQAVEVDGERLEAEQIVIATGAQPAVLDIPGEELLTSSALFMETDSLPGRICFIGGGYISFEFANVASRAGAEVAILDHNPVPLAGFEPDLVEQLVDDMREGGIDVHVDHDVAEVRRNDDGSLTLIATSNGERHDFAADMVVHGAGRVPAVDDLDLNKGNVEFSAAGIQVDEHMQSVSNPHVYAAGDVVDCDQPKLTPVANQQGRTVSQNLLEGNTHTPDYGVVPRVVFSVPELASIGLTEQQCQEQSQACDVRSGDMSSWGSLRKVGGPTAAYKLLIDPQTDRFIGAHLLGPSAAETINLFALAMKFDLTATNMKSVLFAFPTFGSDVREML